MTPEEEFFAKAKAQSAQSEPKSGSGFDISKAILVVVLVLFLLLASSGDVRTNVSGYFRKNGTYVRGYSRR